MIRPTFRSLVLAALVSACAPVFAQSASNCQVTVDGNDAMRFNVTEMKIDKACSTFTILLTHSGKLPREAMGHNWVLVKKADLSAVANDGMKAGLNNDYVQPNDARVLAHTKVIGGGGNTAVKIDVAKLTVGEEYAFFCSVPGHWTMMKGRLMVG